MSIPDMPFKEFEVILGWANARFKNVAEPPWVHYQMWKLKEVIYQIREGERSTRILGDSQDLETPGDVDLLQRAGVHRLDSARPRSGKVLTPLPM